MMFEPKEHETLLERALRLACWAHQGQKSFSGRPYIFHPIRVMEQQSTWRARVVALLHDVVEDTDVTLQQIEEWFLDPDIVEALDRLTHRDGEPYDDYVERVAQNPLATRVKLADLQDNLRVERIPKMTKGAVRRLTKYHLARQRLRLAQKEQGC